jgi:hypothetical protein
MDLSEICAQLSIEIVHHKTSKDCNCKKPGGNCHTCPMEMTSFQQNQNLKKHLQKTRFFRGIPFHDGAHPTNALGVAPDAHRAID